MVIFYRNKRFYVIKINHIFVNCVLLLLSVSRMAVSVRRMVNA